MPIETPEDEARLKAMETDEYSVSDWRGIDNYSCKMCSYQTVEGQEHMTEHIRGTHGEVRREVIDPRLTRRRGSETLPPPKGEASVTESAPPLPDPLPSPSSESSK